MARADFKSPNGQSPGGKSERKTFTMSQYYFELIEALIDRGYRHRVGLREAEIVRAGLKLLWKVDDTEFVEAFRALREAESKTPKTKKASG